MHHKYIHVPLGSPLYDSEPSYKYIHSDCTMVLVVLKYAGLSLMVSCYIYKTLISGHRSNNLATGQNTLCFIFILARI